MAPTMNDHPDATRQTRHNQSENRANGSRADASGNASSPSPLDAVQANLHRLWAAAMRYLILQRHIAQAHLRNALWQAIAAAAVALVGLVTIATAVVLLLRGLAHGLGEALGGREWAGELLVGGFVLFAIASAAFAAFQRQQNDWQKEDLEKYERLRQPRAATSRRAD